MFKLLREQIQTLQNNTHPKLELPRVSTVLIAAVRPESGPSKHPFCPSNWSQISSFFSGVSYQYVTQWRFPVCLRLLWVVPLSPRLLFESGATRDRHFKPNKVCLCVCLCVCVWIGVWMWRSQESRWGRSNRGQNLLLKPSSDGHMQRRSDLRKLLALAPTGCYQFPPALRQMCCTWVAPNPLCLDAEIMFQPIIFLDSWVHAFGEGISENGFQTLGNQVFEYFLPTLWNTGRLLHFPHRGSDVTPFLCALAPLHLRAKSGNERCGACAVEVT